jgi:hypothetical protein
MLSGFSSLSLSDMIIATRGALEHNLFICPLVTQFGFVLFWLILGSSLLSFIFPLGWVLCLMKFTGVSSLASFMKFTTARTSFAFDFYTFSKTSSNLHTTYTQPC